MSNLEDLIVENRKTYSPELMAARAQPVDTRATAELRDDPDRMAKLADLAGVKPDAIKDVAVRGTNVSFMVADDAGAPSAGYFPIAAFAEDADEETVQAAQDAGEVQGRTNVTTPIHGGTATVPTVATEPGAATDDGLPENIDNLTGAKVAGLLKDTPDGVDRDAVLEHEFAREGGPRTTVERAARTLGLLNDEGQPQTQAADDEPAARGDAPPTGDPPPAGYPPVGSPPA